MKINILKKIAVVTGVLFLFSFNKEQILTPFYDARGNSNGIPPVNIYQIDGVFSILHLNYDYGSVLAIDSSVPPASRIKSTEYWKYTGEIYQTQGDTSSKINRGQLFLNDSLLQFSNNIYMKSFNLINVSNIRWSLNAISNYPSFQYNLTRGIANYIPTIGYGDTIKVSNGLNIDLSGLYNADTIYVSVSDMNQVRIQKKAVGTISQILFSSDELRTLTTNGGIISITATNIKFVPLNNKNYLFCSATNYIKLINLKP